MRLLIIIVLLFTPPVLHAQPDRTEMLDQIAKLQLYLAEAQHGYQLVHAGLTAIGEIKQGDFNLHQFFFNALQLVNPEIRSYIEVADILTMQAAMLAGYKQSYQQACNAHLFTTSELGFISQFYSGILSKTADDISELTGVLADADWQMDDAQRLARINKLYTVVTAQYYSFQAFSNQIQLLAMQKSHAARGLQNLTQLIHP